MVTERRAWTSGPLPEAFLQHLFAAGGSSCLPQKVLEVVGSDSPWKRNTPATGLFVPPMPTDWRRLAGKDNFPLRRPLERVGTLDRRQYMIINSPITFTVNIFLTK